MEVVGAGAGIGGKGGQGGNSNTRTTLLYSNTSADINQSGTDGLPGENCGSVNIYNDIEVHAYGGAGGSRRII